MSEPSKSRVWRLITAVWAWVLTHKRTPEPARPALAVAAVAPQSRSAPADTVLEEDVPADVQDHYDRPARDPPGPAQAPTIIRGLTIDGGTFWQFHPLPPQKFLTLQTELRMRLRRGGDTVELATADGELITLRLSWGKRGEIVAETAALRLALRKTRAQAQIKSFACETEGVGAWVDRELRRVAWWVLGVDLRDAVDLVAELVELGVVCGRIEQCVDVCRMPITPRLVNEMVSSCKIHPVLARAGQLEGINIGLRDKAEDTLGIYDALAKRLSQRGAPSPLMHQLREGGWRPEDGWTRIESRRWGKALRIERKVDGETVILDATHPGAPLDPELCAELFAASLSKHWRVDPESAANWLERYERHDGEPGTAPRLRDCKEWEFWGVIRGGGATERDKEQWTRSSKTYGRSLRDHTQARFGQAAADHEYMLLVEQPGAADGELIRRELEDLLVGPGQSRWHRHRAKARARYEAMLEIVRRG